MYVKSVYILSEILFLMSSLCNTQLRKKCGPSSECKLLNSCPQMLDLINSGNPANIEIVRSQTCEFISGKSKVCCSKDLTDPPVDLLPSKCGHPAADDKIANGSPAPIGAYPWMAAIGYIVPGNSTPTFECGGTIINSRYVLTAAHCIDREELGRKKLSVINLGDHNLATEKDCEPTPLGQRCSNQHFVAGIEETVSHPQYNKRGKSSDDVALIRLNVTLDFQNHQVTMEPVCIPPNGFNFTTFARGRDPIATGWGYTERGVKSDVLLRVKIPTADESVCRKLYKEKFVGNQLCIGGTEKGSDTCKEDSGGPLVMAGQHGPPFFQVGIVSFGPNICGIKKKFPSVYANVGDYRDWIITNMRP